MYKGNACMAKQLVTAWNSDAYKVGNNGEKSTNKEPFGQK